MCPCPGSVRHTENSGDKTRAGTRKHRTLSEIKRNSIEHGTVFSAVEVLDQWFPTWGPGTPGGPRGSSRGSPAK